MFNKKGIVTIDVVTKDIDLNYKKIILENTQLLLGYDYKGEPIIIDMKIAPHLLITGLSGQGKTGMLKVLLSNLSHSNIVLCNCFLEDFKGCKFRTILGEDNIYKYLKSIYDNLYFRKEPLYIVLEELATIKTKELINLVKEFLCVARHYNIYIVGVIQIATKEELKFKSYFNARVSFKQQDSSSYQVALGCSVTDNLNQREFFCISEKLAKGKTYNFAEI